MSWIKSKFWNSSVICLIIITISAILFSTQWARDVEGNYSNTISSDGLGYYSYLTSLFINDDFSNQTANSSYILNLNDNQTYNKYFSGTAIMMSPFFAVGHYFAYQFKYKQDGFSLPYQTSIAVAGIFYLLLGLYFLCKLLKTYNLSSFSICATLLLLFFGTNLLFYSSLSPSMSHIYSFSVISIWLYLARKYWLVKINKTPYLFGISLVLGIIVLIRPTNGVVLLLFPFLSAGLDQWKREWKSLLLNKSTILAILIFGLILFIQPLLWYLQAEQWLIWSYSGEGFDFTKPEIFNVLFSFRKGWWIYTPLMLIASIGIFFYWKRNKFLSIGLSCFLILFIYIASSWWNWYYGSSFGQRAFVDIYAIMAFGLAKPLNDLKKVKKSALLIFSSLFIVLNTIQTYQYQTHIISPEFMDFEKYRHVFLKTNKAYKNTLGGTSDIRPINTGFRPVYKNKLFDINCTDLEFCGVIKKHIITDENDGLWIDVDVSWETFEENAANDVLLVVNLRNNDEHLYYITTGLTPIPRKRTDIKENEKFSFHIKEYREDKADLSIYLWNREKTDFKLKTIKAMVYSVKYLN